MDREKEQTDSNATNTLKWTKRTYKHHFIARVSEKYKQFIDTNTL